MLTSKFELGLRYGSIIKRKTCKYDAREAPGTIQWSKKFKRIINHDIFWRQANTALRGTFATLTGIQGATFWMGSEKAVVMMTLRYGWADIFWFSLFHELGHILLHGRNTVILEKQDQDPKYLKQEAQANRNFALGPKACEP